MKNGKRCYEYNSEREELEYIYKTPPINTLLHELKKTEPERVIDIFTPSGVICVGMRVEDILNAGKFDSINYFLGREVKEIIDNGSPKRKCIILK